MAKIQETFREKAAKIIDAARTGGLSLREEIEVVAENKLSKGTTVDYERFLPESLFNLAENLERNPQYLRECFAYMLVTMADAYDSMDHRVSKAGADTELQDDCHAVRELARSFDIPPPPTNV